MERGRRIAIAAVGLVVVVLATVVVLRVTGDGGGVRLATEDDRGGLDGLSGNAIELPSFDLQPGDPPPLDEPIVPVVPSAAPAPPVPLPPEEPEEPAAPDREVITIPLPDFDAGAPGSVVAGTPSAPAFSEPGVWVVKTNGTSPILVARGATAGVAAAGTWIAFVEGDALKAVRRSDLRTKVPLASGISGTAAQGLPIAGGRRGVAYLQGGKAHLADPGNRSVQTFEAPAATAVGAEEDGDGRLLWGSEAGLRVEPTEGLPSAQVHGGVLTMGHGFLAHLRKDGKVAVRPGPGSDWASLSWGPVDRLQTGPAGLVGASGGRVHLRTRAGQDRVLLDRATTPVVTTDRILYVSAARTIATASLNGTDVRNVASAKTGRSISNLDLLDESTLVVTVT